MSAITTRPAAGPVLLPSSFSELMQFATMAAKSDLMPKDYKGRPENIVIAVQMGSEVGLSPMQAIQNIAVIGGRPAIWGDAMLGLVQRDPLCEDIQERIDGEGDQAVAVCMVKRRGRSPITARFSVADAKKAGLWGKGGPWQQYPVRMLQMRARGFALRDAFPDVLRGLVSAEEARDMPPQLPSEESHTTIDGGRAEPYGKAAQIARGQDIITNGSGPPRGQQSHAVPVDNASDDDAEPEDAPDVSALERGAATWIEEFAKVKGEPRLAVLEDGVVRLLEALSEAGLHKLRGDVAKAMSDARRRIVPPADPITLEGALPPVASGVGK